jgi:hypothetical protein
MSAMPEPPRGEFDSEGRPVHPYVRDLRPDASAPGYALRNGQEITQEDRSRESRLAFHLIESLLGHLTPLGVAYLMQALVHRLAPQLLAAELQVQADPDPRNELEPFEELHATRLRAIAETLEAILAICPGCGRSHGEICENALQPGAHVNAATGDAVSVRRVADAKVYVVAQADAAGSEVARVYERDWFERHFVAAGDVEVLGGPVR